MTKKIIITFSFICSLVILSLSADLVYAGCSHGVCADMVSAGGAGSPAVATITNGNITAQQVTFRSYKEFVPRYQTGWLSKQVLFDTQSVWINPGETKQLSVKNAYCLMQSDLYYGSGVTSFFDDNPGSYPGILAAAESIDTHICTVCTNQCDLGQKQCSGNGWQECIAGPDTCTIWSGTTVCASNQICAAGSCVNTCQPSTCDMLHYQCGTFSDGWFSAQS